jgi:hypothetical protein
MPTAPADIHYGIIILGQMPVGAAESRDMLCDPSPEHLRKCVKGRFKILPGDGMEVKGADYASAREKLLGY